MKNRGYSLIEVLAAFAILSIAILPIISMYPAVFRMNTNSTAISESSRIALSVVDYIKAKGYRNLTGINANKAISTTLSQSTTRPEQGITEEMAQAQTRLYVYDLEPLGDSFITKKYTGTTLGTNSAKAGNLSFEQDFNFGNGTDPFFVLNSRGFALRDVRIAILMRRAKVFSDKTFRNPIIINESLKNGTGIVDETQNLYGFRTEATAADPNNTNPIDEFVIGKVIIGRGSDGDFTGTTSVRDLERSIVKKERVYSLQFVITPIE